MLRVRYMGDADYYINGVLAYSGTGDSKMWRYVSITGSADSALVPNDDNVLSAHCAKTGSDDFVDAGVVYKHLPEPASWPLASP